MLGLGLVVLFSLPRVGLCISWILVGGWGWSGVGVICGLVSARIWLLGWFVVFLRVDILQVSCAVLLVCGIVVVFVTMVFWVLLPSWWCGFGALRLWFGLWVRLAGLVLV